MTHFNDQAPTWDSPEKVQMMRTLAEKTVAQLQQENQLRDEIDIIDFGCGTGLFGMSFLPFARTLTGIDTSEGMLAVFQQKTKGDSRTRTICADLEEMDVTLEADLIVSSMAFHHLANPEAVLQKLSDMRRADGVMVLVDLDEEDGSFHPDNAGMGVKHFGFSKSTVEHWSQKCGLSLHHSIIHEISKNDRSYRMFLAVLK